MKKLITMIITLAMVLTTVIPTFAMDADTPDTDTSTPAELTAAQVKAITPKNFKAASYSYTKIKTSWDKIEGIDGYKVYRATSKTGKYTLVRTTAAVSYINTGRTTGKAYYYKMRGYKKIGKTTYYTKYSPVKSAKARLTKPVVTVTLGGTDKKPYDRTPKSSWKAVSGAAGYEVFRSREGKNSYKKIATTKKTYFTDNFDAGFRSWYNYVYKVRAYRTVNGKKVYSYFSTPKKYVPDWTMEELMPELIAYGESIKGQRLEFVGFDANDEPIYKPYVGPEGSTYTMQHITMDGDKVRTPENSSWTAAFPIVLGHYFSKSTVLKETKSAIRFSIKDQMYANQLIFVPADGDMDAYWAGVDIFTLYSRKSTEPYTNGYAFWVMH